MRLIYLICYLFALFIVVCIGIAFFTNPHVDSLSNTNKIILLCISAYCTIAFLILPQFYKHGVITADYRNAGKTEQAKTRFVCATLFMPFWLYLNLSSFFVFGPVRIVIVVGMFMIVVVNYVQSILILMKNKKQSTT